MDVSALNTTSTTAAWATNNNDALRGPRLKDLQPVADALHMSVDDLRAALRTGEKLDDIAKKQGVSQDDLVNAIVKGMQSGQSSSSGSVSAAELKKIAAEIAAGKRPEGHRHHHHHKSVDGTSAAATQPAPTTGTPGGVGGAVNALA